MQKEELHELLEHLHDKYNRAEFIEPDPISIPHSFSDRHDREISGFLAAAIAWGNRKAIVKSAKRMVKKRSNGKNCLAVESKGTAFYDAGASRAYLELLKTFAKEKTRK